VRNNEDALANEPRTDIIVEKPTPEAIDLPLYGGCAVAVAPV
jgi:hypothetical protein